MNQHQDPTAVHSSFANRKPGEDRLDDGDTSDLGLLTRKEHSPGTGRGAVRIRLGLQQGRTWSGEGVAMQHRTGATRKRQSFERTLPPLAGKICPPASGGSPGPAPVLRPGTAVQNFAMGKAQAILAPLLEDMFMKIMARDPELENPIQVTSSSRFHPVT
eukprot:COSAG05_NODE_2154_length_3465_cov_27.250149_2_plen_160_part_00